MKLFFLTKGVAPNSYSISGEVVNGFDLSVFPEGAVFSPTDDLKAEGIHNVERINGTLHVTLGQHGTDYECQPTKGSHDWRGTGEWIDAANYDPNRCYITATSAPEGAEYVKRENGWTVIVPEQEESVA